MDFVAIDFETANEKRNSACSLGLCKVEDDIIVEERYWLIKPPELRFVPQNTWIHGIYPEDVENEKNFKELWEEIKPYLEGNLLIAHNASFDMSVLRSLFDYYGIDVPYIKYACTVILSKNHIDEVKNHKLNTLADFVGYKFKHHHALEDANACANVMIYIKKLLNINDLLSLNLKGGITLGEIHSDGYTPCSSLIKNKFKVTKSEALSFASINQEIDYFTDKVVVFTGPLNSMKRYEASSIITRLGGRVGSSVTKKTDILITGIKNREKIDNIYKSTKLRKTESLIKVGQEIDILTEDEFLSLISNENN
ncbi:exonuclease domain-containing protein [Clostridium sp. SHJSY1]|uniref:exonuclease domain-containing protein n=1 Tax=Clostridium sp. SHJSY1 TaxID=2942483 RepID=UPI002876B333|nr:exonuclease domain-containing protein [Clostridium sp. SHJSY1]MDS0524540.1 exonuclease domain-containing protein [Clostridium sp. SHJSY1]